VNSLGSDYDSWGDSNGTHNQTSITPTITQSQAAPKKNNLNLKKITLIALLAHPRRIINSSPAFFKHEGLLSIPST
jgi:hypothetical protein